MYELRQRDKFINVTDWGHFRLTHALRLEWTGNTITGQEITGSGQSQTRTIRMIFLGGLPNILS